MRDFLSAHLVTFASTNPSIQITTVQKNNRAPVLIGRYAKREKVMDCGNRSATEILELACRLKNSSGRKMKRFNRPVITTTPSIQGRWTNDVDYR